MCFATNRPGARGAVLIVALLLAAITAIALVSFLKLSNTSLNLGRRSFYSTAAMNLAEAGLERALYCVNRNQVDGVALADAWPSADGWTTNTGTHVATATFTGFTPGPNATGALKVYVRNYDLAGTILIVSKSIVTLPDGGPPLEKYIEVTLARRSVFAGLVAKVSLRGDSNLKADSWVSTNPTTGAYTPYSSGLAKAGGPLGVVSATNGALNLGDNPTIYGTVNTGGGTISKSGSAKLASTVGGSGWNTALENKSFTYAFPTITVPSPDPITEANSITTNLTSSATFPRTGDKQASDGKYYYVFAPGKGINYSSGTLTIKQPVVFIMTGNSGSATVVHTSSAATFTYGTAPGDNGSFTLYTDGAINFDSGANWFQNKAPINTAIYGTNPTSQTFVTRGGGTFYGSIIAENATINFDSGTNIMGAFCCNNMTLLGGVNFHYDESLGNLAGGGYRITKWKELQTAAERAAYASALSF